MSVVSIFSFSPQWHRILAAFAFTAFLLFPASQARADDEFLLGKTLLLGVGDHGATIPLIVCRPVKSIMIEARKELTLDRVKVFYGKSRSKTIQFDRTLKREQESGWKSLGSRLCIKRIEVYGNAEGSKAGIRVYGRK